MKIAIIGGGAAGLMAAASARETNPDAEIFVIEKNDVLGKKVIISGGGRCNVTTGMHDVKTVLTNYPRGGKFLSSVMYAFPPDAIATWFESHGVPLKTEEDLRVFPRSDDGNDIVRVFERLFHDANVRVITRSSVDRIEKTGDKFSIILKNDHKKRLVDRIILTTGGQAYRQTGSTGDGYAFAVSLGHSLTTLAPSLSSLLTRETWPADVSGLSFETARISAKSLRASTTGPILFTHKGVSGPAVFAFSSLVAFENFDRNTPLEIVIDLFPTEPVEPLQKRIFQAAQESPNAEVKTILSAIIPKSLSIIASHETGTDKKRGHELSKSNTRTLASWLKNAPLTVTGRGVGDEFVTAGGIALKEVNPKTMESLLCPGLYFAGEILDIDGFTGGFNLTASWATGRTAGKSAATP